MLLLLLPLLLRSLMPLGGMLYTVWTPNLSENGRTVWVGVVALAIGYGELLRHGMDGELGRPAGPGRVHMRKWRASVCVR